MSKSPSRYQDMELILLCLSCGMIGMCIGAWRGQRGSGWLLAVVLGPFSLMAAVLSSKIRKDNEHDSRREPVSEHHRRRFCKSPVLTTATSYSHCGSELVETGKNSETASTPAPPQAIHVVCKRCDEHFTVEASMVGRLAKCPRCAH